MLLKLFSLKTATFLLQLVTSGHSCMNEHFSNVDFARLVTWTVLYNRICECNEPFIHKPAHFK